MSGRYEFRIAGSLSEDLLRTFEPQDSHRDEHDTVFVCVLDDEAELFGIISRCEGLRLELAGFRKLGETAAGLTAPSDRPPTPPSAAG